MIYSNEFVIGACRSRKAESSACAPSIEVVCLVESICSFVFTVGFEAVHLVVHWWLCLGIIKAILLLILFILCFLRSLDADTRFDVYWISFMIWFSNLVSFFKLAEIEFWFLFILFLYTNRKTKYRLRRYQPSILSWVCCCLDLLILCARQEDLVPVLVLVEEFFLLFVEEIEVLLVQLLASGLLDGLGRGWEVERRNLVGHLQRRLQLLWWCLDWSGSTLYSSQWIAIAVICFYKWLRTCVHLWALLLLHGRVEIVVHVMNVLIGSTNVG